VRCFLFAVGDYAIAEPSSMGDIDPAGPRRRIERHEARAIRVGHLVSFLGITSDRGDAEATDTSAGGDAGASASLVLWRGAVSRDLAHARPVRHR